MSDDKGTDSPQKSAYDSLKLKYRRFVDAYFLENGNGAKAVRRMMPTGKRPDSIAYKLLQRPEVRAAIKERSEFFLQQDGVTVYQLRSLLLKQAKFDVRKLYDENGLLLPVHKLDDDTAAALTGIEVFDTPEGRVRKYNAESKQRAALELLKHAQIDVDKTSERAEDEPIGKIVVEVVGAKPTHPTDSTPG